MAPSAVVLSLDPAASKIGVKLLFVLGKSVSVLTSPMSLHFAYTQFTYIQFAYMQFTYIQFAYIHFAEAGI